MLGRKQTCRELDLALFFLCLSFIFVLVSVLHFYWQGRLEFALMTLWYRVQFFLNQGQVLVKESLPSGPILSSLRVSLLLNVLLKTTQISPHQQSFKALFDQKHFLKPLKTLLQSNLLSLKHSWLFENTTAAFEHPPRTRTITIVALPSLVQTSLRVAY